MHAGMCTVNEGNCGARFDATITEGATTEEREENETLLTICALACCKQ